MQSVASSEPSGLVVPAAHGVQPVAELNVLAGQGPCRQMPLSLTWPVGQAHFQSLVLPWPADLSQRPDAQLPLPLQELGQERVRGCSDLLNGTAALNTRA